MIEILLAICLPVFSVVIFKEFDRLKVNTLHAIIFNYLGALLIGLVLFIAPNDLIQIPNQAWFYPSLVVGFLFILNFYLIAKTAQIKGISFATFASKISISIPILITLIWFNEPISSWKIMGILLTFFAIFLITRNKKEVELKSKFSLLPVLVFVCTGILETIINITQKTLFHPGEEIGYFVTASFFISLIFGIVILVFQYKQLSWKSLIAGLVLSIPNTFGVYYFIKSLNSFEDSTSILPILHIGGLILAIFIGYFFYKDKLTKLNWIGVGMALLAIVLLQLIIW